jgi:hypothetical protein
VKPIRLRLWPFGRPGRPSYGLFGVFVFGVESFSDLREGVIDCLKHCLFSDHPDLNKRGNSLSDSPTVSHDKQDDRSKKLTSVSSSLTPVAPRTINPQPITIGSIRCDLVRGCRSRPLLVPPLYDQFKPRANTQTL